MARVNVEEEAWKPIYRVAELLKLKPQLVAGHLLYLWHESQDLLRTDGTFDELVEWLCIGDLDQTEQARWIGTLVRARLLDEEKDGRFVIRGNEDQIEGRISRLKTSSKGGEATKKKWASIKSKKNSSEGRTKADSPAPAMPEESCEQAPGGLQLGAGQDRTRQDRTRQDKTRQDKAGQDSTASAVPALVPAESPAPPAAVMPVVVSETTSSTEPFKPSDAKDLFLSMPEKSRERWLQLYPDKEFLWRETIKALDYYERNPKKYPRNRRGWAQALSTWFDRGWKDHVRRIPSQGPPGAVRATASNDDIVAQKLREAERDRGGAA